MNTNEHSNKINRLVLSPERSGGGNTSRPAGGGPAAGSAMPVSQSGARRDPEVSDKPVRRKFTAKYRLRILEEADACSKRGELGALLRREGLYHSTFSKWRRQRESGELAGLKDKKCGRKEESRDKIMKENKQLRRKVEQLERKLKKAEAVIDIQKKVSELLGIPQENPEEKGNK